MKQGFFTLLLLFILPAMGAARPLNYVISPVWDDASHLLALKIELSFVGDSNGATDFQLPAQFAGARHLYRSISRVRSTNAALYFSHDSIRGQARHVPGDTVKMTYEVAAVGDQLHWCKMDDDFFEVIGAMLFIVPEDSSGYSVSFQFKAFPSAWELKSSFGIGNTVNAGHFTDMRWLSSLFIGGKNIGAIVKPPHGYRKVADCLGKFWEDTCLQSHLVVTLPMSKPCGVAYRGMYLHQCFLFFVDSAVMIDAAAERQFFFHEMTHRWIGGKMRNGGLLGDMEFAWFSEGFTEYMALQAQRYCGFLSDSAWQSRLIRDFERPLAASPWVNAPNSDIVAGFYTDLGLKQLPYWRGAVWAARIDRRIEKNGKGQTLRSVLRSLSKEFEQKDYSLETHWEYVLGCLSKAAGIDLKEEYASFILRGESLK